MITCASKIICNLKLWQGGRTYLTSIVRECFGENKKLKCLLHQVNNIRDKYRNVIEVAKIEKQNGSIFNPNRKTLGKREKRGKTEIF